MHPCVRKRIWIARGNGPDAADGLCAIDDTHALAHEGTRRASTPAHRLLPQLVAKDRDTVVEVPEFRRLSLQRILDRLIHLRASSELAEVLGEQGLLMFFPPCADVG